MPETERQVKLVHITTVPYQLAYFRGQSHYLQARGFSIHAISSPGDLLEEVRKTEGIEVSTVSMAREIDLTSDIVTLWRLWRLLRTLRPDIVHAHTLKAGLLGTIAARAAGGKTVMLSIFGLGQMTRTGAAQQLLNFITRLSCYLADRVWCDSFSMRDYLIAHHLCPAKKLVVLGQGSVNGVDAEGIFSPATNGPAAREAIRSRYNIPEDAPVLGFVGRVVADKGMHELTAAWRVLRDYHPTMHLLLVGPFESKDPLLPEDEALLRADDRVHPVGMRRDIASHLAAMDIFIMPSYREGFGIANIEAAAMALPVISTRIPGCVDSVEDGVTGTLVPVKDTDALVAAVDAYANNPALRQGHGQAGRERALRDFRQESIWEALYQEYARLLQRRGFIMPAPISAGAKPILHGTEKTR